MGKSKRDPEVVRLKLATADEFVRTAEKHIRNVECACELALAQAERNEMPLGHSLRTIWQSLLECYRVTPSKSFIDKELEAATEAIAAQMKTKTEKYLSEWKRITALAEGGDANAIRPHDVESGLEAALDLFRCKLRAATSVRDALVSELTGVPKRRNRRGRKKDPDVATRRKNVWDDWNTNQYKTYAELDRALNLKSGQVRKDINAERERRRSQ